jgi:hypothetical protein
MKKFLALMLLIASAQAFSHELLDASVGTYKFKGEASFKLVIAKDQKGYSAKFTGSESTKCEGRLVINSVAGKSIQTSLDFDVCETQLGFQNIQEMYSAKISLIPSEKIANVKIYHMDKFEAMEIPQIEVDLNSK